MAITQDERQLILTTPLGKDFLLIQSMTAREGISQLFEYDLEVWHENKEIGTRKPTVIDPAKLLGQTVTVKIETENDDATRYFNGMVSQFSQGQCDETFSFYRLTVVPALWRLTQNAQSRIFQHTTVPEIIEKILSEHGIPKQLALEGNFKPRNYCVQYRESDFNFISRLMEEEGIYYFFEHSDGSHKMIIGNTPRGYSDCPSKKEVPFAFEVERQDEFVSAVNSWFIDHNLRTGQYTLWDSKFELPKKNLEAIEKTIHKVGKNEELEVYDYPGYYAQRFDGVDKGGGERPADIQNIYEDNRRTVKIRQEEIDAQFKQIKGSSDCASFTAGHRFELQNHPTGDNNTKHTFVSVTHNLLQNPAYITNDVVAQSYTNEFVCIQSTVPFRPPRVTPKPVVHGSQTAFVAGQEGQEIFTDKYGRVKVQFQWDRESKADPDSSCWIRVAQSWAGKNWGAMFIPRMGMEVIVHFLEGDPDQPIITGCVYNAENMPPYKLPDEKTKSGIKSDSSLGGNGFNEWRFEDKKGSEQIFIHAEKDMDVRVKNDERDWVGNDHHFMVKRDRREKIERDEHRVIVRDQAQEIQRDLHLKVGGKDATEIGGSLSLKVGGAVAEKFGGNHSEETNGSIYIKATQTIVLEAGTGITLKVGGSSININSGGIQIIGSPMVMINSGGSALPGVPGTLVPPMKPQIADPADDAKPGTKMALEKRSFARKQRTFNPAASSGSGGGGGDSSSSSEQKKEKKNWVEIELVNEAGEPVPGEEYKITLPDGSVTTGTLDEKGFARVDGIDPGNCKITFPNLDKDAWEEK